MTPIDTTPFSDATNAAYRLRLLLEVAFDEVQDNASAATSERVDALLGIALDLARSLANAVEANEATVRFSGRGRR